MDDFISISLLSLAMLAGCYVAGIIPLAVNFSEVSNSQLFDSWPAGRWEVVGVVNSGKPLPQLIPGLKVLLRKILCFKRCTTFNNGNKPYSQHPSSGPGWVDPLQVLEHSQLPGTAARSPELCAFSWRDAPTNILLVSQKFQGMKVPDCYEEMQMANVVCS